MNLTEQALGYEYESEHVVTMGFIKFARAPTRELSVLAEAAAPCQPSPVLTVLEVASVIRPPTLPVLEDALANLLANRTPQDQQAAQIIYDDLDSSFYDRFQLSPMAPPASAESDSESDSLEELTSAFCSSPGLPSRRVPSRPSRPSRPSNRLDLLSPIYETPYRPIPALPAYDIIEFPRDNPMNETVEWLLEEANDTNYNTENMPLLAASYDFNCTCCNNPVKIELFYHQ
jgi:hypothetical protein